MEVNKGGRPEIFLTEEQIIQVEALAAILNVDQIADYLNIPRSTFYSIMKKNPEVVRRLKLGRVRAVSMAAGNLLKKVRDGNLGAIIFYLKTQGGWSERYTIGNDQTSEDKVIDRIAIEMSYEEKQEMVAKYQKIIEREKGAIDVSPSGGKDQSQV